MRAITAVLTLCLSAAVGAAEVDQSAALDALQNGDALLIDVRTDEEVAAGALPDAEHVEYQQLGAKISALQPDKNAPIVLYCKTGRRSGIAQDALIKLGYRNVINAGGFEQLKSALEERD